MASNNVINSGTFPSLALNVGGTNANLTASNGGIFYSTASAGAILAGTATANQIILSGASTTPAWSTATYPATTTINQLLYSSSANVIGGLATANSAVLVTNSTGVPVFSGTMTSGQVIIGSTGATPVAASLTPGTGVTITPGAGTITIASTGVPNITTNYQILNSVTGTAAWYSNFYDSGSAAFNLFIGTSAGNAASTSGTHNTMVGDLAGTALTSGGSNTGLGYNVLHAETTGANNTGVGAAALAVQNGASSNTAVGSNSGAALTSGSSNCALGASALNAENTGSNNCAIGSSALSAQTGSSGNTAIGFLSGSAQTSYTNCTFLGYNSDASVGSLTNSIAIGYSASVGASNAIVLGNSSHTSCTIFGIDGKTSASGIAVLINASGVLGTTTSSVRFKQDIENIGDYSSKIYDFRPVNFKYKKDPSVQQYGMIAEEVEKIMPELIVYDDEGKPLTIRYQFVPILMLNEMIKMKAMIERLEANLGIEN